MVINGKKENLEEAVEEILTQYCSYHKVRSRNMSKNAERLVMELRTRRAKELVREISKMGDGVNVSLVTYEGDVVG